MSEEQGFKERVTRQGEEAIGKLAQELLENPVVSSALSAAFETRERAMRAQEVAMGALNLPSASDLERLTRRVRSVSQRLEGIEDGLDRLDDRLQRSAQTPTLDDRLTRIEAALERLETTTPPAATPTAAKATRPAAAKPKAAKAGAAKSGGAKSGGAKPGGAKPGGAKPGGAKPGRGKPSAGTS